MTVVIKTSGVTYTLPSDWSSTNTIECLGEGGSGGAVAKSAGG